MPSRAKPFPHMTTSSLDPVRETAVHVLTGVEAGGRLESLLLEARLSRSSDRGPDRAPDRTDLGRDRRFLRQITAGVVQWRDRLDWVLNQFSNRPVASLSPAIRQVLRLGAYQILWLDRVPERAAVHTSVELAKKLEHKGTAGFVNAILRKVVTQGRQVSFPDAAADPVAYLSVFYSHPRWLVARWLARWGPADTESLLRANNEAPALYVRPGGDGVCLAEEFGAEAVDGHPGSWQVTRPDGLFDDPTFVSNWYVQDINAGLAARLLAPASGDRVLDVCAAPGGKSQQLAEAVGPGAVVATDISRDRLEFVQDNLRRLRRTGVTLVAEDASQPSVRGPFDGILADVPCSGTGVLGRHAEARWRKTAEDLPRHAERQYRILEAAFARLRPGGVLVYSTCSIEEEENDAVVDRFLASYRDARLEPASEQFPEQPWAARTIQTLPGRDEGDGAYAARIRRLTAGEQNT